MSKRGKSITEGSTDANVVSIKTGKSVAELPLDKPNELSQADLEHLAQVKEAELQAKNEAENALRAQLKAAEEERIAALQAKLDASLKQHQEKASLAFELLKAILQGKSETALAGTAFPLLVKNVFSLTDTFKQKVDERWTTDVQQLTAQSASQRDETDQTIN